MERFIEIIRRILLVIIWGLGGGLAVTFLSIPFIIDESINLKIISVSLGGAVLMIAVSYLSFILLNWILGKKED